MALQYRTGPLTLDMDERTGLIRGLLHAGGTSFLLPDSRRRPFFYLHFRDDCARVHSLHTLDASSVDIVRRGGRNALTLQYHFHPPVSLRVAMTLQECVETAGIAWSLDVRWTSGLTLESVEFPILHLPAVHAEESARLLLPYSEGVLCEDLAEGRFPTFREHVFEDFHSAHNPNYPAMATAQLMAYFRGRQGLYFACHDGKALPKSVLVNHVDDAKNIALRFVHFCGGSGTRWSMPYSVILASFEGDWYAAAGIYRNWTRRQFWCRTPIQDRGNVPQWWREDVVPVMLLARGQSDWDAALPQQDFHPLSNVLTHLDRISEWIDAPLMPLIAQWEKHGPWIQPDCFPPFGGGEAFREFVAAVRQRNWRVGMYGNGTNWFTARAGTGYDGRRYFREHGGEQTVCTFPDGTPRPVEYSRRWREGYRCCVAAQGTRNMLQEVLRGMLDLDVDCVQLLDQNRSGTAYSCWAPSHAHPPGPGPWMTDSMIRFTRDMAGMAQEQNPDAALGCEGPAAEPFLPLYAFSDGRSVRAATLGRPVPLYQFLYHEYITQYHGEFWHIAEPGGVLLKHAMAAVSGDLPSLVLRNGGRLHHAHNVDWTASPLDEAAIFGLIRAIMRMRRREGRKFVGYGRMIRPVVEIGSPDAEYQIRLQRDSRPDTLHGAMHFPLVLVSAWQSPDGHRAQLMVNHSCEDQVVTVRTGQDMQGTCCRYDACSREAFAFRHEETGTMTISALSVVLLLFEEAATVRPAHGDTGRGSGRHPDPCNNRMVGCRPTCFSR